MPGAAVAGLPALLADLGQRRVAAGRDLFALAGERGLLLGDRGAAAADLLQALHHLEHDFLQIGLPAFQRADLRLEVFEFLWRGDQPGVQPGTVPLDPGPDLVHVALRLAPGRVPGRSAAPPAWPARHAAQRPAPAPARTPGFRGACGGGGPGGSVPRPDRPVRGVSTAPAEMLSRVVTLVHRARCLAAAHRSAVGR